MSEHKISIPSMLYNAAVGGHVTNSQQIIDEDYNLEQKDINKETLGIPYNASNPNGMGKIVLKKNDNFKRIIEAQTDGNTIFIIKYDFVLTEDVTIPANCVLEFDGGCISGDNTIIGNNTCISANTVKILNTDITFNGTWNIVNVYPEWFGAKGDGITDDTNAIQKSIDFLHYNTLMDSYIRFRGRTYIVTNIQLKAYVNLRGEGIGSTVIKGISDKDVITIVETNNISSIFDLSIAGNNKNVGINIVGGEHFGDFSVLGGNHTKREYPNRLKFTNIYNVAIYNCLIGILSSGDYSIGLFKISNIDILFCDTSISGNFIDGELSHFDLGQSRIAIDASFSNCRISNGKVWFCSGKRETNNFSEDYFAINITGARNIISDIELQDCWCNGMLIKADSSTINNCIFDDAAHAYSSVYQMDHGTNLYSDLVVTGVNNVFSNIKFTFYKTHGARSHVLDIIKNEGRNTFINITHDIFKATSVIQGNPIVPSNTTLLIDNSNFVADNTNITPYSYAKLNTIFKGNTIVFDFVMKTLTNGKYPIAEITTDIGLFYLYVKTYQNDIYVYLNQNNYENSSENLLYVSTNNSNMDLLNKHLRVVFLAYDKKNDSSIGIVEDEKYKIIRSIPDVSNGSIKLIKDIKFVHTEDKVTIESLMIDNANSYLSYLYQTNYVPKICITKYSEVKPSYNDIDFIVTKNQQQFEFNIDLTKNTFNFSIISHHINFKAPLIVTLYGNYYNNVINLYATQVVTYLENSITLYYKDGKIIVVLNNTYNNLYVVNNYFSITTMLKQSTEDVSKLTPITIEKPSQVNPLDNPLYNGQSKFSSTDKKPAWWDGTNWLNSDGAVYTVNRNGTFDQKPDASNIYVGYRYFCTDKQTTEGATDGIEIIHKGNNVWVDALGRVVS